MYHIDGLTEAREISITTPCGKPSDIIVSGLVDGRAVAFLPRHGKGHRFTPSEVNYRANIYALKKLGAEQIISLSACGSLREELKPRDMVFPDQLYDRTKGRTATFFGDGIVGHVGFAHPFCQRVSNILYAQAASMGFRAHQGGTYVCIEGPMFSTCAESNLYRQQGFSIVGMTNLTEAKLAREAEICYASICLITDYDVWKDEEVTVEMVLGNLRANTANVKKLLKEVIGKIPVNTPCVCREALKYAVMTNQ
jgi:5'-methylthioadenosine phosphorylase